MKGVILIVLACTLWAVDTLIRYPLLGQGITAESIVIFEHIILTLVFVPVLYKSRLKFWQAQISHGLYFLIIGGLGSAIGTLAFTKAFTLINPSLVILLQKLQPVFAISLAYIVLGEPIQKKFIYWSSLCLVGGILISYQDLIHGLQGFSISDISLNSKNMTGYGLTLLAVFSWGASTVFGKKLTQAGLSSKEIMGGRFLMGLLCLLPLMTSVEFSLKYDFEVYIKLLLMVLLSGILGMYFYYQGLKKIPARMCSIAEMFFPFCAVAVNWIFLNKSLEPVQIAGGVLLLIGSTIIQIKHY